VKVELSKTARKQLAKAPPQIVRKFAILHSDGRLETVFVEEVNKHDY
jgi:hypothetical protein